MTPERKDELYFERIGKNFDDWMSSYDVGRRIRLIAGMLPGDAADRSCLEVGCGTGRISEVLQGVVGSLTVTDVSEKLAATTGNRLGAAWQRQDACALTFAPGSFDMVVSSECIEHTPEPCAALSEMARVLKPGGYIVVTSPNKLWYPLLWLAEKLGVRKFGGNEVWLFPGTAAAVLKQGGLGDISVAGCHLLPWQLPLATKVLPFFDRFGTLLYPVMINYGIAGRKMPC